MSQDANAAVEATLARAERLFASGLGGTIGILHEADGLLSAKLHTLVRKSGGPKMRFSEAHALLWRKQIETTQAYLNQRLAGHTHAQALKAIAVSVKSTVSLAKKLEKEFTGITQPLALEQQAMQDAITRGTGASLLQQHVASVTRYGKAMVGDFERVLRTSVVSGLTQHQTISRIVDAGELGGIKAATLHANEPGYFPKPTSYVKRRYWAERIVRTETAYAYNAAGLRTIQAFQVNDFPDAQKKILATWDIRTADDSKVVHGQVRKPAEMFVDGAGRHYLHPPARPNDRETVIPWRPHWQELPATDPAPPAEQAAAALGVKTKEDTAAIHKQKLRELVAQKTAELAGRKQAVKAASLLQLSQAAALKLKGAKLPQSPAEIKANAAAYVAHQKAKIAAAELEQKVKLAAALRAKAGETVDALKATGFAQGKDLVTVLKHLAGTNPRLFAAVQKHVTGKAPSPAFMASLGKTKATKALTLAKKIRPDLVYPEKKKKDPVFELELKLAALKNPADQSAYVKALKALPVEQAEALTKKFGWVLKPSGGSYLDLYDTQGTKIAYFSKTETGKYSVAPPAGLGTLSTVVFEDANAAALYANEVSKAIKLAQPAKAAAAAVAAPSQVVARGPRWSEAWKAPARKKVELGNYAAQIDKALASDTRHGHSVAVDGDWIENFKVHFGTEIVQGRRETVVRFKLNEARGEELNDGFALKFGASSTPAFGGYRKLEFLKSRSLEMSGLKAFDGRALGVREQVGQIGKDVAITFWRGSYDTSASELSALHNLVELRFPEPTKKKGRWEVFERVSKELGFEASAPAADSLLAMKRARVMALTSVPAGADLDRKKTRTPATVASVWEKHRTPEMDELVEDADLREVAPGHFALYSPKLAKRIEKAGVTFLKHSVAGSSVDVYEQMFVYDQAGLLSSRERFQRGLVFTGMSTEEDFRTGGADSVFLRLRTTADLGESGIEIDPSELGRFDAYSFNADKYGRAGPGSREGRLTLDKIETAVRGDRLSSSNETMVQSAVGVGAIRKVWLPESHRRSLLASLKDSKITEISGVPVEDFFGSFQ